MPGVGFGAQPCATLYSTGLEVYDGVSLIEVALHLKHLNLKYGNVSHWPKNKVGYKRKNSFFRKYDKPYSMS